MIQIDPEAIRMGGRLADLSDDLVDKTLQAHLTGADFNDLSTEQLIEMSNALERHLLDAIEGFELEVPPTDKELMAAQAADRDEGRWDDGLEPAA